MEETPINYDLVKPEVPPDDSGYMWFLMLVIIVISLGLLGGYYYILYFYDSLTLDDAIEKAIKQFNQSNTDVSGNAGDTGSTVLTDVLDDASTEGFSNYTPISSDTPNLGQLNWCFIDDGVGCNALATEECMSGDIFPTRDVCINPKLRML